MPSPSDGAATRSLLFLILSAVAGVLVAGLALPAVGLVGLTAKRGAENFQSLPTQLSVPPLKQRSRLLAADGSVIATFYSQNRVYVPMRKIAPVMQDAIVATEDARFYDHNGIDLRGTIRALVANTQAGEVTQGGSTITQQYVKNVLADTATSKEEREAATEDSMTRKLRELRYALGLEETWTKERILEGYLNIAYFGSQAYGVEVAAHRYFSVDAADLNPGQAATLAGIVRYPSLYDPLLNPDDSEKRRNFVLQRMADEHMISQRTADKFMKRPLKKTLNPSDLTRGCAVSKTPWFCSYVEQSFLQDPAYGATRADRRRLLNGGGLTIHTTLQMDDQKSAEAAIEAYLPTGDPSNRVAALAMIEPGTGNVTAMDQNLDYGRGKHASYINNAVDRMYSGTSGQQPGSTFKIFSVAAAIEQGVPMDDYIYSPPSKVMPYGSYEDCEGNTQDTWPVQNYAGAPSGNFTIYEGTAYSVNTYFAELAKRAGLCNVWDVADRAGVSLASNGASPLDDTTYQYTPGIIGGGSWGMSPLTMAEAYATFAARGKHCEPRVITEITTLEKETIEVPPPDCEQVIEPQVADAVNDVLLNVVNGSKIQDGTGQNMYLGRPTAGKTGTTDDVQAIWFAGYTPNLAAAVWAGSPVAPRKFPMTNVTINGVYQSAWAGSTLPGPIWREAMLGAIANLPVESFTPIDPELIDGAQLTLPSLAGLTPAKAAKRLDSLDLNVDIAEGEVSSYQPEGTVAYSSPGAGSTVQPGATITLYLSNGVPPPPEPDEESDDGGDAGNGDGGSGGGDNGSGDNGGGGGSGGGDNGGGGGNGGPGNSDGKPGGGNNNN
ncbi:MAG TPA: penicillin-binding protein [Actinomycetes bacterium]|nr:penicillin-binding protein [Actinomycetes bacterium]